MSRQIKIWSFADVDRSGKVRWTAEELGYAVEDIRVEPGEHATDSYLRLNPYGQIPTAEIDGQVHIESTAICLTLAERHPEAGLIPAAGPPREQFWQSLHLTSSTLELPVVSYYLSRAGVIDSAWAPLWADALQRRLRTFADSVPAKDYLCGDFSLADICAAYVLRIGVQAGLVGYQDKLAAYLGRLRARPAARAARFFDRLDA